MTGNETQETRLFCKLSTEAPSVTAGTDPRNQQSPVFMAGRYRYFIPKTEQWPLISWRKDRKTP